MDRLDKNLWYRVKRYPPQPTYIKGGTITTQYKKTGLFSHEASTQPYQKLSTGSGNDKNVTFQLPRENLQPILPQRTFKDLDPESRVIGSLDLTKGDRQKTAVVEGLQGLSDQIGKFMSTPRLGADGLPLIDPISNQPIMEARSLQQILTVSHKALLKALKDNNVSPSTNVKNIVISFTSVQILNVLAKFRGIMSTQPNITQNQKEQQFTAAILNERMLDLSSAPEGIEEDIGASLVDDNLTQFTDNWDIPYTADMFPFQGYTGVRYRASEENRAQLKEYVMARLKRNAGQHLVSVTASPLAVRDMARQFAAGALPRNHTLDLATLIFHRPGDAMATTLINDAHAHT